MPKDYEFYLAKVKNYLNYFLPYTCTACNNYTDKAVCKECIGKFYTLQDEVNLCPICALPFNNQDYNCEACRSSEFVFNRTTALFNNSLQLKPIIYAIKNGNIHTLKYISILLTLRYQETLTANLTLKPDIIIYMPLSKKKLCIRGYNQSLIITKTLSKILEIPFVYELITNQSSHTQHLLNRKERITNMMNISKMHSMFKLELKSKTFTCISNLNIAIVDDVLTTGSSLNSIAYILKQNGAKHIQNIVLARTPI